MLRFVSVFVFLALACPTLASDVDLACRKSGLPVLTLTYRDAEKNRQTILKSNLGKSAYAKFLRNQFSASDRNDTDKILIAADAVKRLLPESEWKSSFLKYSSREGKVNDPAGYIRTLQRAVQLLVPKKLNKLDWFLGLKNSQVESTLIRPANESDLKEMYGAKLTHRQSLTGKFELQIVVSNNASESLPYLVPLIVHELQHAWTFLERQGELSDENRLALAIVDEAKAFDLQMQAYIELANAQPEIFCNWIYVSWSYGDLIVPLSWVMASMELEMRSGKFIEDYAKQGVYGSHKFLFNPSDGRLRSDIQKSISNLKLKYVK